jgi:pSer/pThr/pTyr-binding forkhead associated (FHA) protein
MRARLVPFDNGSPIDIVKDLTLVGRREDCDLRLEHKSVSKMHCVIVKTDGMLLLRDLGSTNGTRVNGQRVRRAILLPDDQLHIASYKFRVQLGPDQAPVPIDEHTQHLDPNEVANLLRQAKQKKTLEDSEEDLPARPLQPNPLPDVYPDDEHKG